MLIRCVEDSTGNITLLSERKSQILSQLWSRIDFESFNEDYRNFAHRVFNLLDSWPSNLPVYNESNARETTYINSDNELTEPYSRDGSFRKRYFVPTGKVLEPCPLPNESLCSCQGESTYGHILHYGQTFWNIYEGYSQERWTEGFIGLVGYQIKYEDRIESLKDCRGRCGIGCSEFDEGEKEIYTQRCFNHDKCVEEYGYIARNCNAMLSVCMYDYLFGTNCGNVEVPLPY